MRSSLAPPFTQRAVAVACLLGLTLGPRSARAQANYDAALIGGRSSLQGGTGVAAGTDAAAPLQNPATTLDIAGTSFVFSTMFLQLSQRSSEGTLPEAVQPTRLGQTQFGVLPNSTCVFADLAGSNQRRQGHQKLSICLNQPEQENYLFEARTLVEGSATLFQNRHLEQTFSKKSYSIGWAYGLSEWVGLGVTAQLEEIGYLDSEAIATLTADAPDAESIVGATGKSSTTILNRRGTAFAASLLTGLQFTLGRGWKAGVSLQLPSLFLTGKYTAARSSEGLVVASEQYSQESGTLRAQYPLRAAFGLAGRVPWFSFEANAYVHGASDSLFSVDATRESVTFQGSTVSSHDEGNVTYRERAIPVTNLGLGISAPIHRDWSLLAGVLTDFSGLAPRQPGSADNGIFRSRRDRIHGSLGVAWTPTVGSLLFGVRGFVGDGELAVSSALRSDGSRLILPLDEWGLSLVISGQLNLQMIAKLDPTGLVEGAAGPAKPTPPK